jgi:hypothetical protein
LTGKPGERFERMILEVAPREKLEIHRTFDSSSERLRKPTDKIGRETWQPGNRASIRRVFKRTGCHRTDSIQKNMLL